MAEIEYRGIALTGSLTLVGHIDMIGFNALSMQINILSTSGTPTTLDVAIMESGTFGQGYSSGATGLTPTVGSSQIVVAHSANTVKYYGKRYVQIIVGITGGSSPVILFDLIASPINV